MQGRLSLALLPTPEVNLTRSDLRKMKSQSMIVSRTTIHIIATPAFFHSYLYPSPFNESMASLLVKQLVLNGTFATSHCCIGWAQYTIYNFRYSMIIIAMTNMYT